MSEYELVRKGKLRLKGDKNKAKKMKLKHTGTVFKPKEDKDSIAHGGWLRVTTMEQMTAGPVAIEFGSQMYICALDNGLFTLGAPHRENEAPFPEEIFTLVVINERKIAFKSGYGKYLKAEKNGIITGRSDAIGPSEQWEPVFQNGKTALQCYQNTFMCIDQEDNVVVRNKVAGPNEILQIRLQTIKENTSINADVPTEDKGTLKQVEINYIKKFQKFQDKKLKVSTEGNSSLQQAKEKGVFHEELLDRRSKMKSDRYCK